MNRVSNASDKVCAYAVCFLPILAPLLGGSVRLWAQATLALIAGMLFLIAPPRRSLGTLPNCAFTILMLLAVCAFLPAAWFAAPQWRVKLSQADAFLPTTVSPQPWLTLQLAVVLLLDASWTYYLFATTSNLRVRPRRWSILTTGMTILGAVVATSFVLKRRVPFWPDVPEFGFFPNRNHTSNVFGLAGIMAYALALRGLEEQRRTWWIWIVALSIICSGLILSYSRAGLVLACGGILVVHCAWFFWSEDRRRSLLSSALIAVLLALLIFAGGKTIARFTTETPGFLSMSQNARFGIQHDAMVLSLKVGLTGAGLGNFSPIFTMDRHDSIPGKTAAHPESDWLWTAVEMGWLGPFCVAALLMWWGRSCFPFAPGTFRLLRFAAFVAASGFALHCFVDVPGHQIGSLWPAVFIASTALTPNLALAESRALPLIFRLTGAVLVASGMIWFASLGGFSIIPTGATVEQLKQQLREARDRQDYANALRAATIASNIAPLDWGIHQARGAAAIAVPIKSEALREFAIARLLLPYWPDLRMKQGLLLAQAGDVDRAFDLWQEAMKLFPDQASDLYREIYGWVKEDPDLLDRWRQLGRDTPDCVLYFLHVATPADFTIELQQLLWNDPQLAAFTPGQLKALFQLWYQNGDRLALAEALRAHPEWEKIAWRELARTYAEYQDFHQAFDTVVRFARPQLPSGSPNESLERLASRFRLSRNEADGLSLARAEADRGDIDDALAIAAVLAQQPRPSPLLYYLTADLWARKQDWPKAWDAISKYVETVAR
jgi:tetratricopeptide (TPR) repeat protein